MTMVRLALLLLLFLFLARAFWQLVDGIIRGMAGQTSSTRVPERGVQMVRDPVCGMFVVPERAVTITDGRRRLFFCSANCRDQYSARTA